LDRHFPTTNPHDEVDHLIPWLVNGTLDGEAATSLREHLAVCPRCRESYESEKRLYETMRAEGPLVFAGEPSFQKLMARMESAERAPSMDLAHEALRGGRARSSSRRNPARTPMVIRWLAAAVLIESAGLGLLAWHWHSPSLTSPARYETLASPAPTYGTNARARVVFRSDLSLHDLANVLHAVDAHIIDGPTDANVYTLGFADQVASPDQLEAHLAALRAQSAVLFAEPASTHGAP
jgi:hypothetical protein